MSNDLISRQAAIDTIENTDWYHLNVKKGEMVSGANSAGHQAWYKADDIYKVLEELPTAQPERKKGKWIYREAYKGARFGFLECSCCGEVVWLRKDEPDKFCRNCGARMEGIV